MCGEGVEGSEADVFFLYGAGMGTIDYLMLGALRPVSQRVGRWHSASEATKTVVGAHPLSQPLPLPLPTSLSA